MVTATPTGAAQGVTPGTPLAPTLSSSGTYQATDGRTLAFGIFNVPALPSQAAGINVLLRANGASGWQQVGQDFTGSSTVRVDDLTPGFAYQVAYQAFNAFGKPSAVSTVLNHTAVGDTNAPSSAGTPTIIAQKATTVTFKWAASASADRRGYNWDLRTAANGGGSVVASGFVEGETLTLDASIVGYGVARHFRVQPVDFSSNPGSFTSSVSVTFAQLGNIDLGSGSVQNPQIGSGAVGTPNIQAGATGGGQSAATDTIQVIGTSEVAVASITVATVGGFVHLSARVPYRGEGAGATSATFRLLKGGLGGTELDSITVAVGDDATLLATLLGKDDPPSASQLYTVVASTNAAAGMTVRTGRRILALNSRP
jgi:hypothetical protein